VIRAAGGGGHGAITTASQHKTVLIVFAHVRMVGQVIGVKQEYLRKVSVQPNNASRKNAGECIRFCARRVQQKMDAD